MGKYKKILVAVDGSEAGLHALKESFKLAAGEGSSITVVSVVPHYVGDLDLVAVGNVMASIRKPDEDALSQAEKAASAKGVSIKTVCEEGEAYERIIELADAENCDLIVIGRRGLRKIERALIGSVASRVIGYSQKDVLVVPSGATIGWKNIIFSTDGSKCSNIAAQTAINFAKSYGGKIKAVSVVDVTEEFMAQAPAAVDSLAKKAKKIVADVKKKATSEGVDVECIVREGEAFRVITDLAREENADVIIMGNRGRTGIKRLLMGSVTEGVIGHSHCPVLVTPCKGKTSPQ